MNTQRKLVATLSLFAAKWPGPNTLTGSQNSCGGISVKSRLLGSLHSYVLRRLHSSAKVAILLLAGSGALFPAASYASLASSVLPTSRSVQVGNTATFFATIVNSDTETATGCSISPVTSVPATFLYQTTDPATNALTGTPNTPVDIAGKNVLRGTYGSQSFILAFTPTAPFDPTDVELNFDCTNTSPARSIRGLNILKLSGSSSPVPDVIALATGFGWLDLLASNGGVGAFAVATVNVGSTGTITASVDTGVLPVSISVCQTNPSTGVCINPTSPAATATTTIAGGQTPTFAFFATATGPIPIDYANSRANVRFTDGGGIVRGSTGVALTSDVIATGGGGGGTGGVYGSVTISGDSQVPSSFTPETGWTGVNTNNEYLQGAWSEWKNLGAPDAKLWNLSASFANYAYASVNGAVITFGHALGTTYTCKSGFFGVYGNCSGATFNHNTRTVTLSNVQLQGPGYGTVITLNGTLKY